MSRTASELTNEEIELVEQLSDITNENYVYRDVNGDFIGVPWGGWGGSGDVNWPVSSINNNFASFNGTDGKTIQDSWVNSSSFTAANGVITGATKTKITYDAKGLVTAGADATTADIAASTDKNYVTDAQQTIIASTTASYTTADETKIDYITVTSAVNLDTMATAVAALDQATILKGTWDASAGTFPGAGVAQAGWTYIVSVPGTVDWVSFSVNDRILAIVDNASTTTFSGNWFKLDYTDQVLSVAGKTGTVTLDTNDVSDVTNKRYVTDANLTTIGNQSGTNTGDNAVNSLYSGLAASKENVSNKATDFTVVNNTLYPTVQAAKDYTDTVAQGLTTKPSARLATTTTLPANTYSNGSSGVGATLTATSNGILTIDSGNVVLNDYILVKDQASQLQNGLYKCTTAGTAGVPYVLTRAVEMNTTLEFSGSYVFVFDGVINENAGFVCTNNTPPTVGTTAIVFVQFSGAGQVIAGNGLSKSANTLSINTAITADLTTAQNLTNKTVTSPTLVTPSAFTTGGTITLAENTSIALDPAGSADWKYSGITMTGTGGATIAFGDLVTLDKDDSRWELVDISVAAAATGDARGIIGIAVTSSTDGNPITVLLQGIIRADANFPTLTIGAAVYASTAGDIVVTQPTTVDYVIRKVWFALTADEIYFNPSSDYITHT